MYVFCDRMLTSVAVWRAGRDVIVLGDKYEDVMVLGK